MLKGIVIAVVVLVGGLLAFAATRPDTFRVERATRIEAPPDAIFPHIVDFHEWRDWSPYEKLDPAMQRSFGGPAGGKGAVYEWAGNKNVGKGRMEILEASAPSRVTIKLDFLEPFEGHNTAEFSLASSGDATSVTWAMHGPSPFMAKLMGVFLDLDHMIGKDFEAGLANLKTIAEK